MWNVGSLIVETPIAPVGWTGVYSTSISAMWDLVSFINETPLAPSGGMVCTVEALLQCGMLVVLSMKPQLRRVAGQFAR